MYCMCKHLSATVQGPTYISVYIPIFPNYQEKFPDFPDIPALPDLQGSGNEWHIVQKYCIYNICTSNQNIGLHSSKLHVPVLINNAKAEIVKYFLYIL